MVSRQTKFKQSSFGHGSKIACGGTMIFGKNFTITAESTLICNHLIEFGDDVLISWECQIMDGDFHKILSGSKQINPNKAIKIGNQVWIGSHVKISKGVNLPNNTVVATGSIVTKEFKDENTIIGGNPGKVIKNNIEWV